MEPIVSVLVPTYNRTDLLIKAVRSTLAQTYRNIEIIVTDNSNTDVGKILLQSINDNRIRYEKNARNIGPILNWRKALEIASGELCLVLPDDDYLINPFYIEDAVSILSNSSIQMVIPDCILAYPNKKILGSSGCYGQISGKEFIKRGLPIPHIGNMFRKTIAQKCDAFHSNEILWSDIELWMKLMSVGDVYCYNNPSIIYLFHDDNIVLNMSRTELITNSQFIRPSVASFADEKLIVELVIRYLHMVHNISNQVDRKFAKSVFLLNGIRKNVLPLVFKIKFQVIKKRIISMLKILIGRP